MKASPAFNWNFERQPAAFWSAALFRRFGFFVLHSRRGKEKTKAAEKRRTPKERPLHHPAHGFRTPSEA
jgi:hypothetical protein